MRTRLHFLNRLDRKKVSEISNPETSIVFYDRRLLTAVPGFRAWLKTFPHAFAVNAGERLKSFESFVRETERVQRRVGEIVTRGWTVVAIGGGSVGDFAGFFASVFKRGIGLVHIPTTWLAAIDSSHGGKTALNFSGAKNQIGTFYPARDTVLVRSILMSLPESSFEDALGELLKIALIDGRGWAKQLRRPKGSRAVQAAWLWRQLPLAIEAKMRIVRRDPIESKGLRHFLNLGHTMGHVIESERGISHGRSVALGILFALEFSEATMAISTRSANEIREWLAENGIVRPRNVTAVRVAISAARRQLRKDKKRSKDDDVWFLVIRGFGKIERRSVSVAQIIEVADTNGWLR